MQQQLKQAGEGEEGREPGIVIKAWDPDTPYLKQLKAADPKKAREVYYQNRRQYGGSPAFFLDCADYFLAHHQPEMALQVLSNIAELELEDAALVRILGHRLEQLGYLDLAVTTFEQVLAMRPEEPQSYRDLALVLARRADERSTLARSASEGPNGTEVAAGQGRLDFARRTDCQSVGKSWTD